MNISRKLPKLLRTYPTLTAATILLVFVTKVTAVYAEDGSSDSTRDKVEAASFAYIGQYAEMERYLVVVHGETEWSEDRIGGAGNFVYKFAFNKGRTSKEDRLRIQHNGSNDLSDGRTAPDWNAWRLKIKDHDWRGHGGHGSDVAGKKPEELGTAVKAWDPFGMPLDYWATLRVGKDDATLRRIVDFVMPVGKMAHAEIDGFGRRIGIWRHGNPRELGYIELTFDPKFGDMPTVLVNRSLKAGFKKVDVSRPKACTELYQRNETKWFEHHTGKFLPLETKCVKFRGDAAGWRLRYEWWLDDEVPDEVFTLQDVLNAASGQSVVDQLIQQREERRAEEEIKRKSKSSPS